MKHKEIIKAWLDGAIVENRAQGSKHWNTLIGVDERSSFPAFSDEFDYRIKPKKYKCRIGMFSTKLGGGVLRDLKIIYEFDFDKMQLEPRFIKWVSEVLEFEP